MIDERILANVPGMSGARAVASVNASELTESEFRSSFVDRNIPVLVKGAVRHWPAMRNWADRSYLKEKVGRNNINLYRHLNYSNDATMKAKAIPESFSNALDVMHTAENEVIFVPFRVDSPNSKFLALKGDIAGMPFLPSPRKPLFYPRARVFMYRGAGSGWHTHSLDETLMCQIAGAKRVAMLPTNDGTYAALKSVFFNDVYLDDKTCFDGMSDRIRPLVADVEAGDALYIPPSWWHGVQPLDSQVGFTLAYCWRSPLHKISDFSYPAVREMWREAFRRPSMAVLVLPFWGIASLWGQCIYSLRRAFKRSPVQSGAA